MSRPSCSPPYAAQPEYDPTSGFKPVPPDEYCEWFRDVAANIQAILAPDGSCFLNIRARAGNQAVLPGDSLLRASAS